MKAEKIDYLSADYQRNVADFTNQHVFYCVSSLISHFAANPDSLDNSEYHWDEILDICQQPSTEPGYEDEADEALEHWIVSNWLASKLAAHGEMVTTDLLGLTVWGRQTSGQAISIDQVICDIYNELQNQGRLDL